MKKVSVQIVTFNSESFIKDCIESILQQTYPIDRIIVIDNASKDKTRQILNVYQGKVTLVLNQENVGFAKGHNQALLLHSSDYHLILNPDVILHPDYVHHLVLEMEKDTSVGSATGKLLLKDEPEKIDSTGLICTKSRRFFDRGTGDSSIHWAQGGDVFGVSGAAALYSSVMINDISMDGRFFDDDFFAYKEDIDVAWRGRLLGWKAYYSADALAYHNRGWKKNSRANIPLRIRRYSYINRYKMMFKNENAFYILKHILPLLGYEIMSLGYFLIREPKVLGAWGAFLLNWKVVLSKRKKIQSKRRVQHKDIYIYFK